MEDAMNSQNRIRGTVTSHGGTDSSTTPEGAGAPPGVPTGTKGQARRTSQPASMVRPYGEKHSGKAMPHQARGKGEPNHGDADQSQRLDAACRQSGAQEQSQPRRSGLAVETRAPSP